MKRLSHCRVDSLCQIVVYGKDGQVPELQGSLLAVWARLAEAAGYDVDGLSIVTTDSHITLIKTEVGWMPKVQS